MPLLPIITFAILFLSISKSLLFTPTHPMTDEASPASENKPCVSLKVLPGADGQATDTNCPVIVISQELFDQLQH